MKRFGLVLVCMFAMIPAAFACRPMAFKMDPIKNTVKKHVMALKKGDLKSLKKLWLASAQMYTVRTLIHPKTKVKKSTVTNATVRSALKRWTKNPAKDSKLTRYKVLSKRKNTATVAITLQWNGQKLQEELQLMKLNGKWKLAVKTILLKPQMMVLNSPKPRPLKAPSSAYGG